MSGNRSLWTLHATRLMAVVVLIVSATDAYPCELRQVSSVDIVKQADAIVRVTAVEYAKAPPPHDSRVMWPPMDSTIRFKVLEVIRGRVPSQLVLPGNLVEHDDYNDMASPYNFVRSDGRGGSCFASSYRSGGQFLLMLKKTHSGGYTPYWYAHGPTNEQLHSDNDQWLVWVREQAKGQTVANGK
jgi:hypothetical protein